MSKPEIVQGRILKKRALGGIVFFEIETANGELQVAAKRDALDEHLYERIKSFRANDYCRLEVVKEKGDRIIIGVIDHIERRGGYFWNSQTKEIVRAYAFMLNTLREFFSLAGYTEVRLPSIHFGSTDGDIFGFDFFGKTARLSSSNSLFLDVYAVQLQKAFSIQKCFRAEKSHTNKHLAEFDMLEAAMFGCSLEHGMTEVENLLEFVLDKLAGSPFAALSPLDFAGMKKKAVKKTTYRELAERYPLKGKGLGRHEREIAAEGPIFVCHFPRGVASWTARPIDEKYARSFNLLLPGVGEVAEGTEKQTDMEKFSQKLQAAGMETQLAWYGRMIPYSDFLLTNFGLGVERLAMWLLGLENIREVHPIYRDTGFSELKKQ